MLSIDPQPSPINPLLPDRWRSPRRAAAVALALASVFSALGLPAQPASGRRPAGPALSARGVASVEIPAQPSANATIRLFSADQKLMAAVQLEDDGRGNATFRIRRPNGERAWVRVKRSEERSRATLSVSSSTGGAFRVMADPGRGRRAGAGPLSATHLEVEVRGKRRQLALSAPPDAKASNALVRSNPVARLEKEVIFTTPTLGLLGDTLSDYGTFYQQSTPRQPTCRAVCLRIAELLPVYACFGGDSCSCPSAAGVFVLSCSTYLLCTPDCTSFGPVT
jgi:hypothetical protein